MAKENYLWFTFLSIQLSGFIRKFSSVSTTTTHLRRNTEVTIAWYIYIYILNFIGILASIGKISLNHDFLTTKEFKRTVKFKSKITNQVDVANKPIKAEHYKKKLLKTKTVL